MNRIVVYPGADPRQNATYKQVREEISKLLHPARPDVNWRVIEEQCLLLFRHHGADLRSVAWFTAARLRRGGLNGLEEGLALLDTLTSRHWPVVWPQVTASRLEALSWLAAQVQHELRRITPVTQDLPVLKSVQQHLENITDTLKTAEPSAPGPFDALIGRIQGIKLPSENQPSTTGCPEQQQNKTTLAHHPQVPDELPEPASASVINDITARKPAPYYRQQTWWKGLVTGGVLAALLILLSGQFTRESAQAQLLKTVPVPAEPLSAEQAEAMRARLSERQLQTLKPVLMVQAEKYLDRVVFSGPDAIQQHAQGILRQMETLWPEDKDIRSLRQRLMQKTGEQAEPEMGHIDAWQQANEGVDALMMRLNTLDERRGRWMTGSELKTAVFAIRRSLDAVSPVEEYLAQIAALKRAGKPVPAGLYEQASIRLRQQQAAYLAQQLSVTTE